MGVERGVKGVSKWFQRGFKGVSKGFQRGFSGVSKGFTPLTGFQRGLPL